jgi:hypothetical protein
VRVKGDIDGIVHPSGRIRQQCLEVIEILQQLDRLILDDITQALLQLPTSDYLVDELLHLLRIFRQRMASLLYVPLELVQTLKAWKTMTV